MDQSNPRISFAIPLPDIISFVRGLMSIITLASHPPSTSKGFDGYAITREGKAGENIAGHRINTWQRERAAIIKNVRLLIAAPTVEIYKLLLHFKEGLLIDVPYPGRSSTSSKLLYRTISAS